MSKVPYTELLQNAKEKKYAVGHFECWDIESLLAVTDAAEKKKSPLIIGYSGIYLQNPYRVVKNPPKLMAIIINKLCEEISVPACTAYNESPFYEMVLEAIEYNYGMVMFSDESISFEEQTKKTREIVTIAHKSSISVEGEITSLSGVGGDISIIPEELNLTDPELAKLFVEKTVVDALAINIGQVHLHGRKKVHLNFDRLKKIREKIDIPLVLHGASSVYESDIQKVIQMGINKVNFGSILKQTFFCALKKACEQVSERDNPYEIIGSGLKNDLLVCGRLALQKKVEQLIELLGSENKLY